jgi:hypothetical protein
MNGLNHLDAESRLHRSNRPNCDVSVEKMNNCKCDHLSHESIDLNGWNENAIETFDQFTCNSFH